MVCESTLKYKYVYLFYYLGIHTCFNPEIILLMAFLDSRQTFLWLLEQVSRASEHVSLGFAWSSPGKEQTFPCFRWLFLTWLRNRFSVLWQTFPVFQSTLISGTRFWPTFLGLRIRIPSRMTKFPRLLMV